MFGSGFLRSDGECWTPLYSSAKNNCLREVQEVFRILFLICFFTAHFTGEIDRERLGELVFKDAVARRKLNRATHPAVTLELAKQLLSHLLQCHSLVMVDMPLLVETGAYLLTWPRVLVKCDPETQVPMPCFIFAQCSAVMNVTAYADWHCFSDPVKCILDLQVRRLVERDGCSKDLAQSKVAAQMPLEQKQKWCQYIIDNSGTRQSTEAQVCCTTLPNSLQMQSPIFLEFSS